MQSNRSFTGRERVVEELGGVAGGKRTRETVMFKKPQARCRFLEQEPKRAQDGQGYSLHGRASVRQERASS